MGTIRLNFEEGWQYEFDQSLPLNKAIKIFTPDRQPMPKYLYKFYNLSEFSLDALEKHYLYAAAKNQLNDDFDCNDQFVDMRNIADSTLIKFYSNFHSKQKILDNLQGYKKEFPIHKAISYLSQFGVISLTENIFSPTMWAHYAESNHGFAVKFNIESINDQLIGPLPVQYKKSWFPLTFDDFEEILTFLYMTTVKSYHWDYEKEWRYIGIREKMSFPGYKVDEESVNRRKFYYPTKAIDEIIIGSRFFIGLNKDDTINDTMILRQGLFGASEKYKLRLLDFITNHDIKTYRIILKNKSSTFELDKELISVVKQDDESFQVKVRQ